MTSIFELAPRFAKLFSGLDTAFGTGVGRWVKRPPTMEDFVRHLQGEGPGIGIAPLRPDSTVLFAAIDLDEPDFDAAAAMQRPLPGTSWVERSRSGNAHILCFFREPIEAWVPIGILKEACYGAGKENVEVFPKNHSFARVRFGSYLNLPYHGSDRPVLTHPPHASEYTLFDFVTRAGINRNDPDQWRKRADYLEIRPPDSSERRSKFGEQPYLHRCAEYIIEHADDNPVVEGHRGQVFFALGSMLTNWSEIDSDEALDLMRGVNEASPDPLPDRELARILRSAERGEYTSTWCDDPTVQPYSDPDCPLVRND